MTKENTPPAVPAAGTKPAKKPRIAKTSAQVVDAARKSVSRAAASVMGLHLKALSIDGAGPIGVAAKALIAALVAPPASE